MSKKTHVVDLTEKRAHIFGAFTGEPALCGGFCPLSAPQGPFALGPRYPTVEDQASSLSAWLDLIPKGYDGDALADTEALYDVHVGQRRPS